MGYTNVVHYPEGKQGWIEAGPVDAHLYFPKVSGKCRVAPLPLADDESVSYNGHKDSYTHQISPAASPLELSLIYH